SPHKYVDEEGDALRGSVTVIRFKPSARVACDDIQFVQSARKIHGTRHYPLAIANTAAGKAMQDRTTREGYLIDQVTNSRWGRYLLQDDGTAGRFSLAPQTSIPLPRPCG